MTPQHNPLSDRDAVDDLLADLRVALEVEPSASFEARVRQHVVSAFVARHGWMRFAQLAVTGAAVLGIAAAWFGWAGRDGSVLAPADPPMASRATAAPVAPTRVAPAPSAQRPALDAERRTPSAERPAPAPGVGNTAVAFDPFRDVVIPSTETRAMEKLVEQIESGPLPTALQRALAFENGDVRVVALNELAPIAIAPLGVAPGSDSSAGLPR